MSYGEARNKMVQEQLVIRGIKDPRVLAAMAQVPRHPFVVEELSAIHGRAHGGGFGT